MRTTDPKDLYLQLFEIHVQLSYLREVPLAKAVERRMEDLWETFDAGERKELAIAIQNIGA